MRKVVVPVVILGLIGLDQWVKFWVVEHIALGGHRSFIPGVLGLTYLQNRGSAFSLLQGQQWLFFVVTILAMGVCAYYLHHYLQKDLVLVSILCVLMAGGVGNFIDRLRLGYVVDMFQTEFVDFAIFNVADSYLTCGVIALMIWFLWEEKRGS